MVLRCCSCWRRMYTVRELHVHRTIILWGRWNNGPGNHPGMEIMLNDFNSTCPMYIACGYTDLRRGIVWLAGSVQNQFQMAPFQSVLFLFCGRRRKALYREGRICAAVQAAGERQLCPKCRSTMTEIGKEVRRRLKLEPPEHEPGKTAQSKSYMRLYRTSGDAVLYEYQPDRNVEHSIVENSISCNEGTETVYLCCTIFSLFTQEICSQASMVVRRCAMISIVFVPRKPWIDFMMAFSVSLSSALVASLKIKTSGFWYSVRAIPIRCLCPPDRRTPRSSICVSSPSGKVFINSSNEASL